jgi:hypothetical protein
MTTASRLTDPLSVSDATHNPYWDAVEHLVTDKSAFSWETGARYIGGLGNWDVTRDRFDRASEFSWTVTAPDSVAFVAEHLRGTAVDPLAGSGYWAYLMAQCGVDVIAADAAPPTFNQDHNRWHYHGQHITVHKANAFDTVCEAHPQRSLLLSWPPYDAPIGVEVLRAFRGDRVVYIGEGEGGCCGDDVMFELLAAEWVEVTDHRPVQWYGIHDWITVYDRKAVTE